VEPDLSLEIIFKFFLASVLGGLIGLERELSHKPAGLRTNMFICVGSALFTILSEEVARRFGAPNDGARIAAQLIPGIGFIGAGAILRDRGSVVGLTTAATIFVNASIGMAVGAGMYWTAAYCAVMILGALSLLGWIEERLLKKRLMTVRITTGEPETPMKRSNAVLEEMGLKMQNFQLYRLGAEFVVQFDVALTEAQQEKLMPQLSGLGTRCEVVPQEAGRE
jgi:putative Mg2+ transporter-C (MgtC) family protein